MNLKYHKIIFIHFIITFCLINFSSTFENHTANIIRDFITSYIQIFKGKDWIMDKDCLSGQFNDLTLELISDLTERNFIKFVFTLYSMIRLEIMDCPLEDIEGILKDLRISMKNGTSIKNTLKNYTYLELELKNYLNSDKSPSTSGEFIGRITKIVVYGDIRLEENFELKNFLNFLQ